jgi:class 3 adenylate cyclase/tetratricopeptide (TPR) repeat protein
MVCSACSTELIAGAQFCHACGTRAPRACPSCATVVDPSFRFCPSCGSALGEPGPTVDTAPLSPERHSPEIPEDLARKILASKDTIEGERKVVTVMFCDLVGSTAIAERLDPEEYHDLLEQYLGLAFHEIYRFEGIVNQLAGDGLMALFGAPIAHEDAPERAVRAALGIRTALDAFNGRARGDHEVELTARIGIHTGPVVVGTVGNDLKMDYTAIGDTTNLASRLESLAQPGAILVSEATYRLVRGRFDMRSVGPSTVKGKSDPIVAYEVHGLRETLTPIAIAAEHGLTPLVGRDPELAQLEACFHQLPARLAQVIAVVGDAGSGKSRLVYEFKRRLESSGTTFLETRCSALNQMVPYHPWVTMLRHFFQITPIDPPEVMCEKVASRVRRWDASLQGAYPYLCLMLSLPAPDVGDMPVEELKRKEFEAMGHLIKAEAMQAPVVIIMEDLHWIDEQSREIVERAVAQINRAPVMLIFTHRPEFQPQWRPSAAFTSIHLRRLSEDETTEILRAVAQGPLPPELEQLVLAKAEGSPFFAEEITRALLEGGYLTRENGHHRLTRPVEEVLIPGTVQEVIAARLDRLAPHAKRALQVAAVLGRQFHRHQLEQLLQDDGIDVAGALDQLEGRGVIHRKNVFSNDEFRFGESLTQEVAYEGLLLKQRRQLHERIGQLLEFATDEADPDRWTLLAHHFTRSDNRQKAIAALLAAARRAERVPSYRSAARLYREAWDLAEAELASAATAPVQQLAIDAAIGIARMHIIYEAPDRGDDQQVLGRACEIADALGALPTIVELSTFKGLMMVRHRKLFSRGMQLVEDAIRKAQEAGYRTATMLRALAFVYFMDGRFAQALEAIELGVADMERAGDRLSDLALGSRFMRDRIRTWMSPGDDSRRALLETYELGVRASNRTIQSSIAVNLAQLHFERGEYADALGWAERSLEFAEALAYQGSLRAEAAIALAARAELGESVTDPASRALITSYLSEETGKHPNIHTIVEVLLQLGEIERAERLAQLAADNASGRVPEMIGALAVGDVMLHLGPDYWVEAARSYEQAVELAETIGAPRILVMARLGAGRVAAERGDRAAAVHHLERARAQARELGLARYAARAAQALEDLEGAAQLEALSARSVSAATPNAAPGT